MNTLFKSCLVVLGLSLGSVAAYAAPSHDVNDGFPAGVFAEDSAAGSAAVQIPAAESEFDNPFESDE